VLQRNETVKLTQPISAIKVPPTVQAVLASRIDHLSAPEKELLQTVAVLGREFTLKLVQRVTLKSDDELDVMLAQLQLGEFINEQPAVGDVEYSFKHALTQEVAYNSLLIERRKALHSERTKRSSDYSPTVWKITSLNWRITTIAAVMWAKPSNIWGERQQSGRAIGSLGSDGTRRSGV
jgi:hypothetical protein